MQNFIVLGFIPGTHIQITFFGWLVTVGLILCLYLSPISLPALPSIPTLPTLPALPKFETVQLWYNEFSDRFNQWLSESVIE